MKEKDRIILSKKGIAKEQALADNILPMSKLIKPIDTENVRSFIGHAMSNVIVNDVVWLHLNKRLKYCHRTKRRRYEMELNRRVNIH